MLSGVFNRREADVGGVIKMLPGLLLNKNLWVLSGDKLISNVSFYFFLPPVSHPSRLPAFNDGGRGRHYVAVSISVAAHLSAHHFYSAAPPPGCPRAFPFGNPPQRRSAEVLHPPSTWGKEAPLWGKHFYWFKFQNAVERLYKEIWESEPFQLSCLRLVQLARRFFLRDVPNLNPSLPRFMLHEYLALWSRSAPENSSSKTAPRGDEREVQSWLIWKQWASIIMNENERFSF